MTIQAGMLVKTLSGTIVKTERQEAAGYWYCDDGRTHLAAAFREITAEERELYAASHLNDGSET
jgi:hypothetical protein